MTGNTTDIKSPIKKTTKVCKLGSNECRRFVNVTEYKNPFKPIKDLINVFTE